MGWLKDAVDIVKETLDVGSKATEIKKTELEVQKLSQETKDPPLVTPASLDDVKDFDPKYQEICRRTEFPQDLPKRMYLKRHFPWWIIFLLLALLGSLSVFSVEDKKCSGTINTGISSASIRRFPESLSTRVPDVSTESLPS